jgi:hypothetical protein
MKMKIKYIIVLLLSLVVSSYSSDSLKVNATLYRLNTNTTLDKIISINKETGEIYESKGSSIKKNFLTDVKEDENLTFYANIQKVDDKDFLIRFPNSRNNVSVKIYDYKGSLVLEKEAYSDLNFKLSQDGIYFIVANDGKEIIKKSINTFAMEISTISNAYPILKSNTIYTFIGIKNGFRPDTLVDIDIANTDTLNFMVKELYKFVFRRGNIEIKQMNVKTINSSSKYDLSLNKYVETKDSSISKIDLNYELYNNITGFIDPVLIGNCIGVERSDTIVEFCNATYSNSSDSYYSNRKSTQLKCRIVINESSISKLYLNFGDSQVSESMRSSSGSKIVSKNSLKLETINIELQESQKNILSLPNNIIYYQNTVSSGLIGGGSYGSGSESFSLTSSTETNIVLTLFPF